MPAATFSSECRRAVIGKGNGTSFPTEREELRGICWNQGLPGDFDVIQITWRPDYDLCCYAQLSKRCRTMYLFRVE